MIRRLLFSLATALLLLAKGTQLSLATDDTAPMRVVQVDLDYVYDEDPDQMQQNLDSLVTRIAAMKISAVFLQAFADPQGMNHTEEAYFPNSKLKLRADLFGRAVKALQAGAHVKVFGWLPVLSFNFGDNAEQYVLAWNSATGQSDMDTKAYRRLSPFDMKARADIISLYEDMAKAAPIDGILFHDDAMLSDFEDASPDALAFYAKAGLPASIKNLRSNAKTMQKWTEFKTAALVEFTHDIAKHVRAIRPQIQTVRNIYAPVVLDSHSEQWFAQSYPMFLKAYDYVAIEAMPKMENVDDDAAEAWLKRLVDVVAHQPKGLNHTIFELQAVDWRKQSEGAARIIPADDIADEMELLADQGALNFGYYPDDYVTNTPDIDILSKHFSLQTTAVQP